MNHASRKTAASSSALSSASSAAGISEPSHPPLCVNKIKLENLRSVGLTDFSVCDKALISRAFRALKLTYFRRVIDDWALAHPRHNGSLYPTRVSHVELEMKDASDVIFKHSPTIRKNIVNLMRRLAAETTEDEPIIDRDRIAVSTLDSNYPIAALIGQRGVVAQTDLMEGDVIGEYTGEWLSAIAAEYRYERATKQALAKHRAPEPRRKQLDFTWRDNLSNDAEHSHEVVIDSEPLGNYDIAGCVNDYRHDTIDLDDPRNADRKKLINVEFIPSLVCGEPRVWLVITRPVIEGEELLADYGKHFDPHILQIFFDPLFV